MFGNWWRVAIAGLLGAVSLGSVMITGYLSRLEQGVQQNLQAGRALVEAQAAIRDSNAALGGMVAVTDRLSEGLNTVLRYSEAIQGQVRAVGAANLATLRLNDQVLANNAASAKDLTRVVKALRNMNTSASSIRDYLTGLRDTAAADVQLLRAIGANTARMNARTPGR